ncbi:MAG: hypothetical protein Q9N62_09250 [Ghiorsea sp.]|nr:hypothetical protein [Ghiorsea sp.]
MEKMTAFFVVILMAFVGVSAHAEEGRGSVGAGTYVLTVVPSVGATRTFAGSALVASYDFSNLISVAGHYYALTDKDFSVIEMNGFDVMLRAGKNDLGFNYFGALGYYNETFSTPLTNKAYTGTFVGYGIGYSWDNINVTWEGGFRTSGSEDPAPGVSTIATTGALNVSYRF